ncbi:hypothetical protein [Actinomadura sp. WMMA1423]|uniref:hypothetical protein n=1 Tax=Actinomadura sp. WMMA1423 TaxID=2591108 RepID=UPI001146DC4D|nr:hypothetical protein [Actinomadura sp. WMMA1423]
MRCPNCGTDSASSSSRCAHCGTPLDAPPGADDATAQDHTARAGGTAAQEQAGLDDTSLDPTGSEHTSRDPFGAAPPGQSTPGAEDATTRHAPYGGPPYGGDPAGGYPPGGGSPGAVGGVPVPRDPIPPPWADQNPVQWEAPPDHTLSMPPGEERTTQLSPEPWAAEPAIWQPPAPPKRSMVPYFLGAAGVVLLIGLAVGIVFWPSGSDAPPTAASGPSAGQSQDVASASDTPTTEGDLDAQAAAVNGLLEEMGGTRSDLGAVVAQDCPVSGVRRVLDARRAQLEKARGLEVGALLNGEEMKDALVRALEASTESNQRYLDGAPGCPSEGEVADVNQRASSAKSEFIGYWNPVAEKAGLPTRGESDI